MSKELTGDASRGTSDRAAYVLTLIVAALLGGLYYHGMSDPAFLYLASNALPPMFALVAAIIGFLAFTKLKMDWGDRYWVIWTCFSIGMLFWFLGELVWGIYTLLLNVPAPYPSIADIFWLAGYPLFFWALFIQVWPFKEAFSIRSRVLGPISMLIVCAALLWVLIPSIPGAKEDGLSIVIGVAYPLFDVLLLAVAIPVLLLFRRGSLWKPIGFVIFGIILNLLGDLLFALLTLSGVTVHGLYYTGVLYELLFLWSYLAFALGFYVKFKHGAWLR